MLIELNYPDPVPVELPAAQTLLLIIDMENENAHPDGALFIGEDEKEVLQAFSLFTSFGYKHNVTMTRSDLIGLRPSSGVIRLNCGADRRR